jgi:hypothetical protein
MPGDVRRRASEVQGPFGPDPGIEGGELGGVGRPWRRWRIGIKQQSVEGHFGGRRLWTLGPIENAVGTTGAPEPRSRRVGGAVAKRGRHQITTVRE